jgi:hypothetical protein
VRGSRSPNDDDGYSTRRLSLGESNDEPFGAAEEPRAWYLKPWVLALWGLTVVILIATIIYGLVILATNNGGSAPTTTRPSSTTPSRTTSPPRTTTPSSTVPSTSAVPSETTEQPAPPPTTTPGRHRHHWNGTIPPLPALPPIHIPGVG